MRNCSAEARWKITLCIAVKFRRREPKWVKSGKARPEYLTSAFHPIADLIADVMGGPLRANSGLGSPRRPQESRQSPLSAGGDSRRLAEFELHAH